MRWLVVVEDEDWGSFRAEVDADDHEKALGRMWTEVYTRGTRPFAYDASDPRESNIIAVPLAATMDLGSLA